MKGFGLFAIGAMVVFSAVDIALKVSDRQNVNKQRAQDDDILNAFLANEYKYEEEYYEQIRRHNNA